jgi:hypothetical protein
LKEEMRKISETTVVAERDTKKRELAQRVLPSVAEALLDELLGEEVRRIVDNEMDLLCAER